MATVRADGCISVVVPAFNAATTIGDCIAGLRCQTIPSSAYEVIVVDDGSIDCTADLARQTGALVVEQPHSGRSAARNNGARIARGDVLLFIDADCVPATDWIEQMIGSLDDPEIVAVKGAYRTHQRGLMPRFIQVEYESKYERLRRYKFVEFVDSYSAGYIRSVFCAHGGFDSKLVAAEDIELSFRLARAGRKMVFNPQALVYHHHGTCLRRYLSRKLSYGRWRALVYARYPGKMLGDGHTPAELFAQIPLSAMFLMGLMSAPFEPKLLLVGMGSGALFLLSSVPFVLDAWRRDPPVAVIAPAMLLARALSLGIGLASGLVALLAERLAGLRIRRPEVGS